jgi:hypothetical protein
MKIEISEKQLKLLLSKYTDEDLNEVDAPSTPSSSSSSAGSTGGYPAVHKWESGATRGPGNQVGVTNWSTVVGAAIKRSVGNYLTEDVKGDDDDFKDGSKFILNNPDFFKGTRMMKQSKDKAPYFVYNTKNNNWDKVNDENAPNSSGGYATINAGGAGLQPSTIGNFSNTLSSFDISTMIGSSMRLRKTMGSISANISKQKEIDAKNVEMRKMSTNGFGKGTELDHSDAFANDQRMINRNAIASRFGTRVSKHIITTEDGKGVLLDVFDGNWSLALLELREFMFSGAGLITQLAVAVLGAEIGAGEILKYLDYALAINDLYVLFNNLDAKDAHPLPGKELSLWDKIVFLCQNNPDFMRVIEDVALIATFGLFKLGGNALGWLERQLADVSASGSATGAGLFELIQVIKKAFGSLGTVVGYVGEQMGKFLRSKIGFIDKFYKWLEELASKTVSKEVTVATDYGVNNIVKKETKPIVAKIAAGAIVLPMIAYQTSLALIGFELGLPVLKRLLKREGVSSKNLKSQTLTQEEIKKVDKLLVGGLKSDLAKVNPKLAKEKVQQKYQEQILNHKKDFEDKAYDLFIKDKVMSPKIKRDQFSVTDEKYSDQPVYLIMNQKYYAKTIDEENYTFELVKVPSTNETPIQNPVTPIKNDEPQPTKNGGLPSRSET